MISILRGAWRSLRRSPSFVLAVVATLGIGIGLNAAIFAVVDCVLLRPLGYHDADRIVALRTHLDDGNRSIPRLGGDDYADLARQVTGLEATARYESYQDGFAIAGMPFFAPVAYVSSRFAEVMGVEPIAGRLFHPGAASGTDALVGEAFARAHFGSAPAALGHLITYTGRVYTIAGVLPAGFTFPRRSEIWFEAAPVNEAHSRTAYNDQVVGKRRIGVSQAQLGSELASFSSRLAREYPEDRSKSIEAVPLGDQLVGSIRPTLRLLMGAVSVILLIIGANLMHLQLVRATREARAQTIRTALGASRAALAIDALFEAGLLACGGTLAALAVAYPALRLLVRLAPADLPRIREVTLNVDVVLFAALASFVIMAATALFPLWRASRANPSSALHGGAARGGESRARLRLRGGLVVAEIALTLTLSVAAVLLAQQLIAASRQDLGFAPQTLITLDTHAILSTPAPVAKDDSPASAEAVKEGWDRINQANLQRLDASLATVAGIPGVESTAAIAGAPMSTQGGSDVDYAVRGRQVFAPGGTKLPHADLHPVTPGLFATLGVPILRGRDIAREDRLATPQVVLISQGLARSVFPGQNPLGHQITCGYDGLGGWWTIVGVVGDVRGGSPGAAAAPTLYVPVAQHPREAPDMQLVVRTGGAPAAMVAPAAMLDTLRKTLAETHPDLAVKAATMRENIGETERADDFRAILLASFAGVSILLAAVGMYGVTSYTVAQRRFEFGLRIALGSTRSQLLLMVLRSALTGALAGIALGIALSLSLTRVLASMIGPLPAFDIGAYGLAALAVLLLCTLPTLWPAQSAASADPMQALRSE